VGKLIHVGGRLAVLGVDPDNPLGPWHIMRPGGFAVPQVGDAGKTIGGTMCRRHAITNGYAADFTPQHQELCPACAEQL
jgi:hypothetical protein